MAWYDSWEEAAADVLTGGTYTLTKAAATGTAAAAAATEVAATAARKAAGLPAATAGSTECSCCPRFQIDGPFLLETHTGRVWRFDQQKGAYVPVQRKLSALDWEVVNQQFQQRLPKLNADLAALPAPQQSAEQAKLKALQTELANLK